MRNVSDKSCRENEKTHFMFSNFFCVENITAYEIKLKNTVVPESPQTTKWFKRFACWITRATNTHSAFVILIGFRSQQ
jgi:hypothetical protein